MLPVCVPALPPRASITRKLTRIDKKLTLICKDFIIGAVVDDVHLISILVTLNMRVCGFSLSISLFNHAVRHGGIRTLAGRYQDVFWHMPGLCFA